MVLVVEAYVTLAATLGTAGFPHSILSGGEHTLSAGTVRVSSQTNHFC